MKGYVDSTTGQFTPYTRDELAILNKQQQQLEKALNDDAIRDSFGNVIGYRSDPPGTPMLDPSSPDYQRALNERKQ